MSGQVFLGGTSAMQRAQFITSVLSVGVHGENALRKCSSAPLHIGQIGPIIQCKP